MMKKVGTNSANMKLNNMRLILNIIRKKAVSRADLARMTGLTRAAVTLLIDEMIDQGIIMETETSGTDFGRKPMLLDLKPDCYFIIGVYISREGFSVGLVNIKGEIIHQQKRTLKFNKSVDGYIADIVKTTKEIIVASGLQHEKFLGVGISAPGPIDINNGIILNPPNFDVWHNVRIAEMLEKELNLKAYADNNSASLTLVEKNYGRGVDFSNFLQMVVDTGIGSGIVINDNLFRGFKGFGSEVGHISIDFNGRQCSCGNIGCVEAYAAIPEIINEIKLVDKRITAWPEIVDKALQGDKTCEEAVVKEARYLSAGIISVINMLELDAVILTGDINYKGDLLLGLIQDNVNRHIINRHTRQVKVMNSWFNEKPEVLSAAVIVIEKFFNGEIY